MNIEFILGNPIYLIVYKNAIRHKNTNKYKVLYVNNRSNIDDLSVSVLDGKFIHIKKIKNNNIINTDVNIY